MPDRLGTVTVAAGLVPLEMTMLICVPFVAVVPGSGS